MTVVLSLTAAAITTCLGQQGFDYLPTMGNGVVNSGMMDNRENSGSGPQAVPIVGIARVVDGDSIRIGELSIRLEGIDAPELGQTCERNGAAWGCGVEADQMLRSIIRGQSVSCAPTGRDRYGRMLAVCHAGPDELNAGMVRSGFALSFTKYSVRYAPEESAAKAERAGMWNSTFVEPWNWRKSKAGN